MAKHRIAWLPGDGIGIEVLQAARIVLDAASLSTFIRENQIKMAILTVPAAHAQEVVNLMVESGIQAILNGFNISQVILAGSFGVRKAMLSLSARSTCCRVSMPPCSARLLPSQ